MAEIWDEIKENKAKLSMTKDVFYTSIATIRFGILVIGTQLFARSVVKKDLQLKVSTS